MKKILNFIEFIRIESESWKTLIEDWRLELNKYLNLDLDSVERSKNQAYDSFDVTPNFQISGFKTPGNDTMYSLVVLYSDVLGICLLILVSVSVLLSYILDFFCVSTIYKTRTLGRSKYRNIYGKEYRNLRGHTDYVNKKYNSFNFAKSYIPFEFSKKTETFLDVLFLIIPTLIIIYILIPTIGFLYSNDVNTETIATSFTIDIIGNQWYWTYAYNLEICNKSILNLINQDYIFQKIQYESILETNASDLEIMDPFNKKFGSYFYQTDWFMFCDNRTEQLLFLTRIPFDIKSNLNYHKFDLMSIHEFFFELGPEINYDSSYSLDSIFINSLSLDDEKHLHTPYLHLHTKSLEYNTLWYSPSMYLRLLEVDKSLYIPVNVYVDCYLTSDDVVHSWAVPQLGIKVDAIPGRISNFLLYSNFIGIYYGQCSELCGVLHGFMPISVHVMTQSNFFIFINSICGWFKGFRII